jgi:sugar phosphate isomerase/epimerase
MKKPIAVQLYSVREQAEKDFIGTLKHVAKIGYKGVEGAGFYGLKPKEARKVVEDFGMVYTSNHSPWACREHLNEVIEVAGELGIKTVVGGYGPDDFKTVETIKKVADETNYLVEKISKAGLTLALHNHWWEFNMVNGRRGYNIFLEMCPTVKLEIDIYWASNMGECDPVKFVAKNKARMPLMHVKDGTLIKDAPFLAVGKGKINVPAAINAADEKTLQWLIVELDNCATDMFQAVEESYNYLVGKGLAVGNR